MGILELGNALQLHRLHTMPRDRRSPSSEEEEEDEEELVYEVEKIVQHKSETDKKGRMSWKFLVRWKGYTSTDDTWEPRTSLLPGAENVLDAYITAKANKGIYIGIDGEKKKARIPEQQSTSSRRDSYEPAPEPAAPAPKKKKSLPNDDDDDYPASSSSTTDKRRQSQAADREDSDFEAPIPKKKKSSLAAAPAPAPLSASPEPPRRESLASKPSSKPSSKTSSASRSTPSNTTSNHS